MALVDWCIDHNQPAADCVYCKAYEYEFVVMTNARSKHPEENTVSHTENDNIDPKTFNQAVAAAAIHPNLKIVAEGAFQYDDESYPGQARRLVRNYVEASFDKSDPEIPYFEVFVVWFCKTLQNWKALVSTTLPDLKYYEVTYDGEKDLTYLDVYLKVNNMAIPGPRATQFVNDGTWMEDPSANKCQLGPVACYGPIVGFRKTSLPEKHLAAENYVWVCNAHREKLGL